MKTQSKKWLVGVTATLALAIGSVTVTASKAANEEPAVAAMKVSVAALQRRVQILKDINDIENLVSAYGYYLDKQQWDDFADLFTENGSIEISRRGVYVGKASIRRSMELYGPQNIEPNHVHNHQQVQPVIHVSDDGTKAWVRSRGFSQLGTYPRGGAWMDGVYENELVKQSGVWKFQSDHIFTTFSVDYDKGWAFGARPTPKPNAKIPPDRPSTIEYEAFPEVFVPPYHYENPVTGSRVAASIPQLLPLPKVIDDPALKQSLMQLTDVAARIERLEDEQAIIKLQRIYGFYVEKARWDDVANLFADDATLEIGGRGVFVGKKRVLEYMKWLAPKGLVTGELFNHIQLQPLVTVARDGNTARMRSRMMAEVATYQKAAIWGFGTYENDYVKEHGVWKIKALNGFFRMYTPYDKGWGKEALANTKPEKDLPPDRPPTVVYEQYPSVYFPPYHYKNPVTAK
jgi:hypothetical protein